MKVEIISTRCIKPSIPTPQRQKTHKLSLLDHFVPPMYIPIVLFYTADQGAQPVTSNDFDITQQRLKQLKQSLSEALAHFYRFAGRIEDKLSIDCNDEGVYYTEAKASCNLFEFLKQSNLSSFIHKLLPREGAAAEGYVAMIQVTCFECGGIVIGSLVSHMIADGAATSFFLNSWGATSRGAFNYSYPNFDTPFPLDVKCPKDANVMALCGQFLKKGRIAMRRFLFSAEAISKLKTQGSSLIVQNPTRVEVVSCFICKCVTTAFKKNSGLERPALVTHAVNMRRRESPAFLESCMGNFIWTAIALMSEKEKVIIELPYLVTKLREAMTSINSDFVKSFQGKGGFVRYGEVLREMVETASSAAMTSRVNYVHCTSWCNFGLYNVDYGWGKPAWVSCSTTSPDVDTLFFNSILLMDTPSGNGVEAWIYLNEDDMAILQQDRELLATATIDPNPLQLNG